MPGGPLALQRFTRKFFAPGSWVLVKMVCVGAITILTGLGLLSHKMSQYYLIPIDTNLCFMAALTNGDGLLAVRLA